MSQQKKRRPSIKDVARACGVAPSTVSNALSNRRYVRPDTRQLVIETAERLGYRASAVARGLRMERSWSVGLMLASISNPFYPEVARGVEDVVTEIDCNLILCNTDYHADKQDRYLRVLLDRRVDGIIMGSHPDERHVAELRKAHVPYVLLNKGHGVLQGDYVGVDNRGGIAKAVDHLVTLGHRRIGFIRGHPMSGATEARHESYIESLHRRGCEVDERLAVNGRYDFVSGQTAAQQLLDVEDPPTAIISANDIMAIGAITAIRSRGLRVPEDISVVGFDDIFLSSLPMVQLTTIRVPKRELGAEAARVLVERIGGARGDSSCEVVLPAELIERQTTAPVRLRHGHAQAAASSVAD